MANNYYTFTPAFVPGQKVRSDEMNTQLVAIETAFNTLPSAVTAIAAGQAFTGIESGSGNSYVVTMPTGDTRTAYNEGDRVSFKATHTNTGATTVNIDSLGLKSIVTSGNVATAAGDITSGLYYELVYSATTNKFQVDAFGSASVLAAAAASAAAALVSENAAAAHVVLTAADVVSTSADAVSTAADVLLTNADVALTHADVVLTHADVVLTNADAVSTAADVLLTNADAVSTAADAVSTAADLVQTNLDQISCAADAASTAADVVSTAADVVLTGADVALTGADVVSAEAARVAAVAAQTSAETALDTFDDIYLGAKSSAPTLDNDGNALATGALYWNTVSSAMYVWSGSAWGVWAGNYLLLVGGTLTGDLALKTASFSENDEGNSSTAVTIDWTLGNKALVTMTGNATLTFTAPAGDTNLLLRVVQDGTGSRTITWPAAVKWPSGSAPTLTTTAAAIDIITFYYDGTNYYGGFGLAYA